MLHELHRASQELDQRAREALAGGDTAALVSSMERWVELVEQVVHGCPPGPVLEAYRAATARLEASLAELRAAQSSSEVTRLEGEMAGVVELWTDALTQVVRTLS